MIEIAEILQDREDIELKTMLVDVAATLLLENEEIYNQNTNEEADFSQVADQTDSNQDSPKSGKLVCGQGINDANYKTQSTIEINGRKKVYRCPYYVKWKSILVRCYSSKYQSDVNSIYYGHTIAEEWKRFSKFKAWMENQDWIDRNINNNLIVPGAKVYSEETCMFVPSEVGFLFNTGSKHNNEVSSQKNKQGVTYSKQLGKYKASITKYGRAVHVGYYNSSDSAHEAYKISKGHYIIEIAQKLFMNHRERIITERSESDSDDDVNNKNKNAVVSSISNIHREGGDGRLIQILIDRAKRDFGVDWLQIAGRNNTFEEDILTTNEPASSLGALSTNGKKRGRPPKPKVLVAAEPEPVISRFSTGQQKLARSVFEVLCCVSFFFFFCLFICSFVLFICKFLSIEFSKLCDCKLICYFRCFRNTGGPRPFPTIANGIGRV